MSCVRPIRTLNCPLGPIGQHSSTAGGCESTFRLGPQVTPRYAGKCLRAAADRRSFPRAWHYDFVVDWCCISCRVWTSRFPWVVGISDG